MHNIFGDSAFIENTHNGRELAWHRLGIQLPNTFSAVDGTRQAFIDFDVNKYPTQVKFVNPDNPNDFTTEDIPDQFALYREPCHYDPNRQFLGIVGKDYTVVQNIELAEYIDHMLDAATHATTGNSGNKRWSVETIGALGKGDRVFFVLETGDFQIKGDPSPIKKYFMVTNYHNGLGSLLFGFTGVRVVCQNTFNMAMSDLAYRVTLKHSNLIKQETQQLLALYSQLQKREENAEKALQLLSEKKLDWDTAKDLVTQIYKLPAKPQKAQLAEQFSSSDLEGMGTPISQSIIDTINDVKEDWEKKCENVKVQRFEVLAKYEDYNDEMPALANTAYTLYQGVTEYEDWLKKGRGDKKSIAENVMFGDRADRKADAFRVLSKV